MYFFCLKLEVLKGLFLLSDEHGFLIDSNEERRNKSLKEFSHLSLIGVPEIWGLHWKCYSNGDSFLQINMQNSLSNFDAINGFIDTQLKIFLLKRIEHCISMSNFLRDHSFSRGLFKMGWFYK